MDIVVLGYTAHPYTKAILREFTKRKVPIKALVQRLRVDYPPELVLRSLTSENLTRRNLLKQVFSIDNLKRGVYNPVFALSFLKLLMSKKLRPEERRPRSTRALESEDVDFKEVTVKTVNDFNSMSSERLLRHLAPDLIILGPAAQIIRGNILRIPRIGTLNAHQGILPGYRGMDVLEYSILNGDEPGVTVHFVDEGVDTGDIILRRYLGVSPGGTLEELREQVIKLSVEALADVVEMIESDSYQREPQDPKAGKQFYPIHTTLRDITRSRLQEYTKPSSPSHKRK